MKVMELNEGIEVMNESGRVEKEKRFGRRVIEEAEIGTWRSERRITE